MNDRMSTLTRVSVAFLLLASSGCHASSGEPASTPRSDVSVPVPAGGTPTQEPKTSKRVRAYVVLERTSLSGRVDPDSIGALLRSRLPALEDCYAVALLDDPDLEAAVGLNVTWGTEEGRLGLGASGGRGTHVLDACVYDVFDGVSFPEPEGGIVKLNARFWFGPKRVQPEAARP
jgi:hypothetical protein